MQNQTAVAIFLLCAMQVARLAGRVGISGLVDYCSLCRLVGSP